MEDAKSGKPAPAETGNGLSKIEQLPGQLDQNLKHSEASLVSQAPMLCILGHDPGVSGATSFYFPAFDRLTVDDNPVAGGEIDVEIYAPAGGEKRLNWKIVVDAVLSARTKPKAKNRANTTNAASTPSTGTGAALDDDLPF